jgi:hypothetical protein
MIIESDAAVHSLLSNLGQRIKVFVGEGVVDMWW